MSGVDYAPLPTHSPDSPVDLHPYPPLGGPYRRTHRCPQRCLRLPRPRLCLKYTASAIIIVLIPILSFLTWEPHIEISFYWRSWVRQEIESLTPLRGCFKPDQASPLYNVTEGLYGRRHT